MFRRNDKILYLDIISRIKFPDESQKVLEKGKN